MTDPRTKPSSVPPQTQPAPSLPPPTLETVVAAICSDARNHSRQYAMRSDTGHDGE
ncbi:MAG: hypothetical protein ACF788_01915 [Novipirellula sp. JB048]